MEQQCGMITHGTNAYIKTVGLQSIINRRYLILQDVWEQSFM
jgi:hypothetical protein